MASGKEIRINITSALNAAGIEATKRQVDEMAKSATKSMADLADGNKRHWADIKAAWDMGCAAIQKAWQTASAGLRSAFRFETQTTQFKTLIGNIDEAKRHMADLKELGDTPPFSLDEFAAASRSLMVMTDGALGYKKSLELIGDAAAATGKPVEEMGHAVGRLYAFIRDGQPLSRAVMELRNMGVITPEVADKLQDLQNAGKSNAEIWAEVEAQLGRYRGAMAETETTGEGLIGAIKTRWDNIVRKFGDAFTETSKSGMKQFLDKAKELEESGTLEVWADRVQRSLNVVIQGVKSAIGWASKLANTFANAYKWVQDTGENIGAVVGTWVGAATNGASFDEASQMAGEAYETSRKETTDRRVEQAKREAEIVAREKEKVAKREEQKQIEAAKRAAEEQKRITESLSAGQKATEERKAADKLAKEKKEQLREQVETEKKQVREMMDERLKALFKEAEAQRKLAAELEENAARARGKSFGDWQRGERDRDREARKTEGDKRKREEAVQREIDRLEEMNPRAMTKGQRERLAKLREWQINQDPNNNPALKKAQEIEKQREQVQKDMAKRLESIDKNLKKALTV